MQRGLCSVRMRAPYRCVSAEAQNQEMGASGSQTKPQTLEPDQAMNPVFGSRIYSNTHKTCEKDGNFNFLSRDDEPLKGDENRNQLRPRVLGLMGRDPPFFTNHYGPGTLSPLSRLPCWSPLEPLPEIESGDDTGGRVPPDGAEEGKMEEEMRRVTDDEKEWPLEEAEKMEELLDEEEDEDGMIDWDDSDGEFEFSYRSENCSLVSTESGDITRGGAHDSIWEQICHPSEDDGKASTEPLRNQSRGDDHKAQSCKESVEVADPVSDASSDSDTDACSELPDVMEAIWPLQDRERFKAQEMEKHQIQLTMYRRLAVIRWVRTLQNHVQDQQNRLQSSFDIILTHRKELLRMGATAAQ